MSLSIEINSYADKSLIGFIGKDDKDCLFHPIAKYCKADFYSQYLFISTPVLRSKFAHKMSLNKIIKRVKMNKPLQIRKKGEAND